MGAIVVSDLHIGSRFFYYKEFERFLENISEHDELILNGDIIDNPKMPLSPSHQRILDRIKSLSYRQKVVWVQGNHENGYIPNKFGNVLFKGLYALGNRVLIIHGYDFDDIMPRNQAFIKTFKLMHDIRVKLGAKPVHVAEYAKKWRLLYKVLCDHVMINAVQCAAENGFDVVACGHTHYPEDRTYKGIRYINTGAWTELPAYYIQISDNEITLKAVGAAVAGRLGRH
jgi:UDP-2,3-diacylglucosamine pyrophosphatase LpxH